ncbi:MAG TPA: hypothetical protein VHW66_22515 [Stellaceae bacterium]|jgi:hypothetical protein|nr:hypothetical protein [Stellaceae bacterium]
MTITALDTHETVKNLTAVGFSDAQAEALTQVLRQGQDIDLSKLVTKTDLALALAEAEAKLVKWVIGVGFAQVAMIIAVLKLFPNGHP